MTRVKRQSWSPRGYFLSPWILKHHLISAIVPGGRFLFTKSAIDGDIALWDLGNVGTRARMTCLPVALLRDSGLVIMDTCPTADGSGLLLSTYRRGFHPLSDTTVVIYEIYPQSGPYPQFTRKGELNINGNIDLHSNSGGLFAFLNEMDQVVLWNLATNDSITWKPPVEIIQALSLMDRYLIILSSVDITMWEIPIFRKDPVERCDGDLMGCSFGASQPTLKHTLNYPTFSGRAIFSSPSSWWPSSGDVPIGVASEKNSSEDKMAFYMLESGPTSNWARPRVRTASFPGLSSLNRLHHLCLCNKNICQRWRYGHNILIGLMATPNQADGIEGECVAITRSIFCGPAQDFYFCAVSGRLVIIKDYCASWTLSLH